MPQYHTITKLPDLSFIPKRGRQIVICSHCVAKYYTNEPGVSKRKLGKCFHCEEYMQCCRTYDKKRLVKVEPKKRQKVVSVWEKFNISRR